MSVASAQASPPDPMEGASPLARALHAELRRVNPTITRTDIVVVRRGLNERDSTFYAVIAVASGRHKSFRSPEEAGEIYGVFAVDRRLSRATRRFGAFVSPRRGDYDVWFERAWADSIVVRGKGATYGDSPQRWAYSFEPSQAAPLAPRVRTYTFGVDSGPPKVHKSGLYLPPRMRAALSTTLPGFRVWTERDYLPEALANYPRSRHQLPWATVADFTGDGWPDVVLVGSKGEATQIVGLVPSGDSVVTFLITDWSDRPSQRSGRATFPVLQYDAALRAAAVYEYYPAKKTLEWSAEWYLWGRNGFNISGFGQ